MSKPKETVICGYSDWKIIQTEKGLILRDKDHKVIDVDVTKVYQFDSGEYEDREIAELEKIVHDKNIRFDICGEIDDCSKFVFWKIV